MKNITLNTGNKTINPDMPILPNKAVSMIETSTIEIVIINNLSGIGPDLSFLPSNASKLLLLYSIDENNIGTSA
jgi:hypothetical protein